MKKTLIFLLLIMMVAVGYKLAQPKQIEIELPVTNIPTSASYTDDDRKEKIARLSNPNIVLGELARLGQIITLQGEYTYKDKVTQKGIADITLREMNVALTYRFGFGIDMKKLQVAKIEGSTITIMIPSNQIQLLYLEMIPSKSTLTNGKKMILVSQFTAEDAGIVIEQAQDVVTRGVKFNKEYQKLAVRNLKYDLDELLRNIGYSNIEYIIE